MFTWNVNYSFYLFLLFVYGWSRLFSPSSSGFLTPLLSLLLHSLQIYFLGANKVLDKASLLLRCSSLLEMLKETFLGFFWDVLTIYRFCSCHTVDRSFLLCSLSHPFWISLNLTCFKFSLNVSISNSIFPSNSFILAS